DADRADAGPREPVELLVARAVLHHRDAFRAVAERFHCIQGHGVVVAVRVWLHHDDALEPELLLQLAVHRHGEVAGIGRARLRAQRTVVEMHVRVARTPGHLRLHFFPPRFGDAGFGTSSTTVKTPPW